MVRNKNWDVSCVCVTCGFLQVFPVFVFWWPLEALKWSMAMFQQHHPVLCSFTGVASPILIQEKYIHYTYFSPILIHILYILYLTKLQSVELVNSLNVCTHMCKCIHVDKNTVKRRKKKFNYTGSVHFQAIPISI